MMSSMETFAARGLLADIGALLDADENLSQTEFLQNVFDAYSMDGKLHQAGGTGRDGIAFFRPDVGADAVLRL